MKLVRFGAPGAEKPGLVGPDGTIRDLSAHVKDIDGSTLGEAPDKEILAPTGPARPHRPLPLAALRSRKR